MQKKGNWIGKKVSWQSCHWIVWAAVVRHGTPTCARNSGERRQHWGRLLGIAPSTGGMLLSFGRFFVVEYGDFMDKNWWLNIGLAMEEMGTWPGLNQLVVDG